jgi:translocation and assembly module TamB
VATVAAPEPTGSLWTSLRRVLFGLAGIVLAVLAAGFLLLQGLDTDSGRAFLAKQLARIQPESGLRVAVGRVDGSVFSRLTVYDLTLSDPQGVFLRVPQAKLDWKPAQLLRKRVIVDELTAPTVDWLRLPKLNETTRDGPILPDIDIRVGRLAFDRVVIEAPVAGRRQVARLTGTADIASGRAKVDAVATVEGGTDRVVVKLDAEPDRDRFDVDIALDAPAPGVLAAMLGTTKPLSLRVAGDGSWQRWSGRADARYGDGTLAALALSAQDGRFAVNGTLRPALLAGGIVERLTRPEVRVTASALAIERRLQTAFTLASPEVTLGGDGTVDLAEGVFRAFNVNGRLLRPKAFLTGVDAADMRLALALDGAIARPRVTYTLTSPRVAVSTTILEKLRVIGKVQLGDDPLVTPVTATVARVRGLGADLESILTNVRLEGPVRIDGLRLSSNALRLRTDKFAGRAVASFDLAAGRYDIRLDGTLSRYLIPGLGIVDVVTDLRVVPNATGGTPRLSGKATARVVRLDNAFFASLLEGLPTVVTDLDLPPGGAILFRNARLSSPALNFTGSGSRAPDGNFRIEAAGSSRLYGPLTARLGGPITRPTVDLTLARPGYGIGLAAVRARVVPAGDGWAIAGTGRTDYGPTRLSARVLTGTQTVLDIGALDILGVRLAGPLRSVTGGFDGTLAVTGSGLGGTLKLAPERGVQRVDASLTADRARLATEPVISVARGTLTATARLGDRPSVVAKLDASGVRRDTLALTDIDADIDWQDGRGRAVIKTAGRQGVPFRFDGAADFAPDRIAVTGRGNVEGRDVGLDGPAVVTRTESGWRLAPTEIGLGSGEARVEGSFGDTLRLSARLDRVGLDLLDLAVPGLALGGTASGTLDVTLPPADLPSGRAALRIAGFTRAGIAAASLPVNIGVSAAMQGRKAGVLASFARGGRILGRAQAQLTSIPGTAADPVVERLLAAPLAAAIRFTGPSDALWPLTNIDAFDVRGPISVSADVSGRLGEPELRGRMQSTALRVESTILGTVVTDIAMQARFDGSRVVFDSLAGTAGTNGRVTGGGSIDLSAARGFPIDMRFDATRAQLLRRDDLRATGTGQIRVTSDAEGGRISGNLVIDRARFRIGRPAAEDVPDLPYTERNANPVRAAPPVKPTIWRLDIDADARNEAVVEGMGLNSEWSAKLKLGGEATRPRITGTADLIRGDYEFAGKRFELTRGRIRFLGAYPPDPLVDIAAEARVEGLTATLKIGGTALKPEIAFGSIPALPEDEVLSRVLFGTSITNLSAPEALQLAGAVASLRQGNAGNFDVLGVVRRGLGVDRLRILPSDTTTGRGASVAAGEYLGDRIYLEVATDAQGYTATQIEVSLTRALSILSQVATQGGTSVNLKWSKDY